jgi:ferredoxin, 2Fe-2S
MARVTYIEFSGSEHVVEAAAGQSVMEAAVKNGVPGIDALCGGVMACGTCHVFVEPTWLGKLPETSAFEETMLGFSVNTQASSRLACQLKVTEALDGLVVRMPESQP